MQLELRPILDLQEALALAPRLDASAAEFHGQVSDDAFPEGASARFLETQMGAPETVLVAAFRPGQPAPVGLVLSGPFSDPLGAARIPLVLVLHVDPDVRHCGVARALVEELRALLGTRGLHTLAARASHNDDALISMGERWGFTRSWELMQLE